MLRISLVSGRSTLVNFDDQISLGEVKAFAQRDLGVGFLRLSAEGRILDPKLTVVEAGLKDGDCVTGIVQEAQLAATSRAFAIHCHNPAANVITWGHVHYGADDHNSVLSDQRSCRNVTAIQGNLSAFAAILDDGTVVAWGDPKAGGDYSS
eukprot:s2862_g4.t1